MGLLCQEAPEQEWEPSLLYLLLPCAAWGLFTHTCVPCASLLPGLGPSVSVVCSQTAAVMSLCLAMPVLQPVRQIQPRGRGWMTFSSPGRARLAGKGQCPGGGEGA